MIEFFTYLFGVAFLFAIAFVGLLALPLVIGILAYPFVWLFELARNTNKN